MDYLQQPPVGSGGYLVLIVYGVTTRVSNPVCYPRFRASASETGQDAAFATGVPLDIYAFHRYT